MTRVANLAKRLCAAGLSAVALQGLLLLGHGRRLAASDQLPHADFGLPLTWVHQDLSARTYPSYPARVHVGSPWEHPTEILSGRAGVNALVLCAVVLLGLWCARLLRDRLRLARAARGR